MLFRSIDFPTPELMNDIVRVHHPKVHESLVDQALKTFYEIRSMRRLRKRPSTSELVDWIAVLQRAGIDKQLEFLRRVDEIYWRLRLLRATP